MPKVLFWTSLFLIIYPYLGYPVFVTILSFLRTNKIRKENYEPSVSLIIAAYNEEKHIEAKLKNSFALEYPRKKLEIIVASDGSTDRTDEIVKRHENCEREIKVILHRVEGRLGKTAAQNSAVGLANGEILVFSDTASMYDPKAIRNLVRSYVDPRVGAVSGRYEYINPQGTSAGFGTILFWKFENFIKLRQMKLKTITGCCGCIYSVRKDLYTPLPPQIISDLVEPLTILERGYIISFEPQALAFEETAGGTEDEFRMRIRVIVRGMNGLLYVKQLMNPFRYPAVAFQLLSHKVLRWLVPIFCILMFISNLFLLTVSAIYVLSFICQIAFYSLAATAWFMKREHGSKLLYLPLYFCTANIASLISLFKVCNRENIIVWQTRR